MQAPNLDIHQAGSRFGDSTAFHSQILQGNFHGLTINPTAAIQAPLHTFQGHYAHSSLRPVPTYVPRPQLHQKIKEQLHDVKDDGAKEVQILVVWGLGGAGKSQLVLNYVQQYREDYTAVFWIEAGSKETIERDYIQTYGLLYGRSTGAGQETVKVEDAVSAVKRWFHGRKGRWLVVLDSVDTIDNEQDRSYINLEHFMPDAPGVYVVVTSRSSTAREMTQLEAVEVAEMEAPEATELFKRSAKLIGTGLEETREIGRIVEELGYLALAITLAGSYVSVTPRLSADIKGYLPEYRIRRKILLQRRPKQYIHRYGESVLSTWESSFEAITTQDPAAARLLSLLAFMNFEDIFVDLFNMDRNDILAGGPIHIIGESEVTVVTHQTWRSYLSGGGIWTLNDLELSFEILQSYSLLQWKPDQKSYAMHKLVHAWGHDRLGAAKQVPLNNLALELLAEATSKEEVDPSQRLRLVPHVMAGFRALSRLNQAAGEMAQDILAIIDSIEGFLYRLGRWSEAYEIRLFHFTKVETMLGKEHPDTLISMNNLAEVLRHQGKYEEAERMYRDTLALKKLILGKEHPSTLVSIHNLASVLKDQGKYEEAERIYREALALYKSVLGKEHLHTLTSVHNLAIVLSNQGKYEEAERMYREVLAFYKSVLGKEHPYTLTNIHNLAGVLRNQGKYEEAERIYREVLALKESVLGKEHPETLASMSHLAALLSNQGKYDEAERIQQEELASSESILGKEHPETLISMSNLAGVLSDQGKYDEAERIYREAITLKESVLGKEHPETLMSIANLALTYWEQDRWQEAEGLEVRVIEIRKRILGAKHPNTITSMHNLAYTWKSQSRNKEAISLMKDCFELRNQILGPEHPNTESSLKALHKWESEEDEFRYERSNQLP